MKNTRPATVKRTFWLDSSHPGHKCFIRNRKLSFLSLKCEKRILQTVIFIIYMNTNIQYALSIHICISKLDVNIMYDRFWLQAIILSSELRLILGFVEQKLSKFAYEYIGRNKILL